MMRYFLSLAFCLSFFTSASSQNYLLDFDGLNDYVNLGNQVGNNVRTIEMWFKPTLRITTNNVNYQTLFMRNNSTINTNEIYLYIGGTISPGTEGRLVFAQRDASGNLFLIKSDSDLWEGDQLYHVAVVIDPQAGMMMYIDGVLQTDTNPYTGATTTFNTISALGRWGDEAIRHFYGQIDEVRIWTRALSQFEIQTNRCQAINPAQAVGLQGYYQANEGTGSVLNDQSANGYNGTIIGAQWFEENYCDNSEGNGNTLDFDGGNDYVTLDNTVADGVRTVMMWVKPNKVIDQTRFEYQTLFSRNNGILTSNEIQLFFSGTRSPGTEGRLLWGISGPTGSANIVQSDANQWNAGQWYHIAAVSHPVDGMKLYVDGIKQVDTESFSAAVNPFNAVSAIGRWGDADIRHFDGRIDEVSLWTVALTDQEIMDRACGPVDVSQVTGLRAYYTFNEGAGTFINDFSGNGHHGDLFGADRTIDTFCITVPDTGRTLEFDGQADYVNLGTDVTDSLRSIEMWFKLANSIDPTINDFITLIGRETSITNIDEFSLFFQKSSLPNPGKLRFLINETVVNFHEVFSDNNTWQADRWYHVAVVIHPSDGMMMFIDGVKQSDTNTHTQAIPQGSTITTLGSWGNLFDRYFEGRMDEVRLWNSALSAQEINDRLCDTLNLTQVSGLKAYYNFNEGIGSTAVDQSGNGFDALMTGVARVTDTFCIAPPPDTGQVLAFFDPWDHVDLGDTVAHGLRTIELWFAPEEDIDGTLTMGQTLIGRSNDSTTNGDGFQLSFSAMMGNAGKLFFNLRDAAANSFTVFSDRNNWAAGTWYHVAVTIDASAGLNMYVDGVLQQSNQGYFTALATIANRTTLGIWGDEPNTAFRGRMDEIRLWQTVRTKMEIQTSICDSLDVNQATGLRAYYTFGEAVGDTAVDFSGNGFDGEIKGPARVDTLYCEDFAGFGDLLEFDGADDFVNLGQATGNNIRTIELWMSPDTTIDNTLTTYQTLIGRTNSSVLNEFGFELGFSAMAGNEGKLYFTLRDVNGSPFTIYSDTTAWSDQRWYHVAVTVDSATGMKMMIDGIPQSDTLTYSASTGSIEANTVIGKWGDQSARYFKGRIDEVRMWTIARSPIVIRATACDTLMGGPGTGLQAYYTFNEGIGNVAFDQSGNLFDGTISGALRVNELYCQELNTAVGKLRAEQTLRVYPNPMGQEVRVQLRQFDPGKVYTVSLYSTTQQLITERVMNGAEITLARKGLTAGVYFLVLKENGIIREATKLLVR